MSVEKSNDILFSRRNPPNPAASGEWAYSLYLLDLPINAPEEERARGQLLNSGAGGGQISALQGKACLELGRLQLCGEWLVRTKICGWLLCRSEKHGTDHSMAASGGRKLLHSPDRQATRYPLRKMGASGKQVFPRIYYPLSMCGFNQG